MSDRDYLMDSLEECERLRNGFLELNAQIVRANDENERLQGEIERLNSEIERAWKKVDALEADLEERAEGDRERPTITMSWYCRNCGKRNSWAEHWCQHCEDSDE